MTQLKSGTVESNIIKVVIGEVDHPITEEHSIVWVYLQTDKGGQCKCLEVGATPSNKVDISTCLKYNIKVVISTLSDLCKENRCYVRQI